MLISYRKFAYVYICMYNLIVIIYLNFFEKTKKNAAKKIRANNRHTVTTK